jgi:hypothetical protein
MEFCKIFVIFNVVFFMFNSAAFSQKDTLAVQNKTANWELYSNGGFGKYFSTKKPIKLSESGNIYFFQLQLNYKYNYFTRLTFDQYSLFYSGKTTINGLAIQIKDKPQTTNLDIDFGYAISVSKKVSSFAYLGIGRAVVQVPNIKYDNSSGLDIFNVKKPFLSLRGGIGGDYEFSKLFIAYVDLQYLTLPLSNHPLNGIGVQIGFKTKLY